MCTKLVTNRFKWWFSKEREREGLPRVENIGKIGRRKKSHFLKE